MFPIRPTSAQTATIGATPTAPQSIWMQGLYRARRLLSNLTTPSSDRHSLDVPTQPSTGPATRTDLRNGKSINNFQGMFPIRPTSAPTTAIGATPTAPPSIRMQGLKRARKLLSNLGTPSSGRLSPDVPARPSLGPATSNFTSVTSSATPHSAHSVYVTASLPPYSLSSTHAPPQEIRHAPNVIKLSPYHQAEPASQWWSLFMAMVAYFNMSESAAVSAFSFYLTDIPKQWDHYSGVKIRIAANRNASKSGYFRKSSKTCSCGGANHK
uniref:Uncharacterized protein n=1 Tax=Magallana gigas TaxID=29159 RepID=A0A8W8NNA9_MAGGI